MPDDNTATATETPEWTKDPAYEPILKDLPKDLIRATVPETLAEINKSRASAVDHISKTRKVDAPATPPKADDKPGDKKPDDKPAEIPASVTAESTGLDLDTATADDDEDGVATLIEQAGFKGKEQELFQQWEKDGKFTDEQYAAFKKAGRSKSEVNAIAAGYAAQREAMRSEFASIRQQALDIIGGEDDFKTIQKAAVQSMSESELARLDGMLKTKDAVIAAAYLRQWYDREFGGGGRFITGNGRAGSVYNKPTTIAEAKELNAKALKGDEAARAIMRNVDIRTLK